MAPSQYASKAPNTQSLRGQPLRGAGHFSHPPAYLLLKTGRLLVPISSHLSPLSAQSHCINVPFGRFLWLFWFFSPRFLWPCTLSYISILILVLKQGLNTRLHFSVTLSRRRTRQSSLCTEMWQNTEVERCGSSVRSTYRPSGKVNSPNGSSLVQQTIRYFKCKNT